MRKALFAIALGVALGVAVGSLYTANATVVIEEPWTCDDCPGPTPDGAKEHDGA